MPATRSFGRQNCSFLVCSIRRQVPDRVARVAEERGESERQRMIGVRRTAMLDSAQLYHDLASTIGSSLTDLVRKRRQLDEDSRERGHVIAALDTTTSMTTRKNLRQRQVFCKVKVNNRTE